MPNTIAMISLLTLIDSVHPKYDPKSKMSHNNIRSCDDVSRSEIMSSPWLRNSIMYMQGISCAGTMMIIWHTRISTRTPIWKGRFLEFYGTWIICSKGDDILSECWGRWWQIIKLVGNWTQKLELAWNMEY